MRHYGIIGKKGSGKSHLSEFLQNHANLTDQEKLKQCFIENIKMADPLKHMIRGLLSQLGYRPTVIDRMVEGDLKEVVIEELGKTPRHLMQTIGTEWGRDHVCEDLWGKCFTYLCKHHQACGNYVVCDDVRFDNEVLTAVQNDLTLIRIVTPDDENATDTHRSEQLPDMTYVDIIWMNDKQALTIDLNRLDQALKNNVVHTDTKVVIRNNEIMNIAFPDEMEWTWDNINQCIKDQEEWHRMCLEGTGYDS